MEPDVIDTPLDPPTRPAGRQPPVMAAISKSPEKRSDGDVDSIMKALEYAPVFLPLPPTVRRQLCASLRVQEVKKDVTVVKEGAELDFWYIMQGSVKEIRPPRAESEEEADAGPVLLSPGDSFGVPLGEFSATEDIMISQSTFMIVKATTLLWLNRDEVLRIAHPTKESTRRVEDSSGELVAVTTYRAVGHGMYQQVVVKAAASKLPDYLLTDEGGPQFMEDFLLTLPVFMKDSEDLMEFLTNSIPEHVDKVSSVLAIWIRSHGDEFKEKPVLRQSLEYIVSALDECPSTANTKYLQALAKRMNGEDQDSLSVYSIGKSQSVTSTCSRDSFSTNGDYLEEDSATTGSGASDDPATSSLSSLSTLSASAPATPCGNSLLRSTSVSIDRRKSTRFRRRTHSARMFGDKIPLKIYNSDGVTRIVPILDDLTCAQVLPLAVKAFGIDRPPDQFTLVNVSVAPPDIVKQRNIQATMLKLSTYQRSSSRIYLKDMSISGHVTSEETTQEMIRSSEITIHSVDLKELVRHLTVADFTAFKTITATDYILDTFEMQASLASEKRIQEVSELVNSEMMWVVHEVCMEQDMTRRSQVIRIFIELALLFQRVRNFNSMLAIVSGLSYTAVTRLKRSWEKVPRKLVQMFEDMQQLLDPSRNMANYRELLSSESLHPPFIPFFPIIKKDLAFLHLGNKTKKDGLMNVDKLRMVANEVRKAMVCTSRSYTGNDLLPGLPVLGSHLVLESFETPMLKKCHQYLMADQCVSIYMKSFDRFNKDEKTLLDMSRELESNDPLVSGCPSETNLGSQLFIAKSSTLKRGQTSLRKAFNKYITK